MAMTCSVPWCLLRQPKLGGETGATLLGMAVLSIPSSALLNKPCRTWYRSLHDTDGLRGQRGNDFCQRSAARDRLETRQSSTWCPSALALGFYWHVCGRGRWSGVHSVPSGDERGCRRFGADGLTRSWLLAGWGRRRRVRLQPAVLRIGVSLFSECLLLLAAGAEYTELFGRMRLDSVRTRWRWLLALECLPVRNRLWECESRCRKRLYVAQWCERKVGGRGSVCEWWWFLARQQ
jgi:hypothetical protein